MTITITALTNDKARLVASVTTTTCERVAEWVVYDLQARGFIVITKRES